ncbi:MAG: oligosaccharide flippase family protein [Bacteroidota bacterium]
MNREFLVNIIFLLGINLLIKPIYLFGIDRNVQNILPEGEYGLYAQILSLTYLFQILADFGIQNYNNRQIAQHRHLLSKYFSTLISLKALLALVFAIAVFTAGYILQYWEVSPLVLGILVLNQILLSYLLFLRSNISGLGMYRWDSFLSILDKLVMIALLGSILWLGIGRSAFRLEWFVLAQTLSFVMGISAALLLLRGHLPRFKWQFKWRVLLVIFRLTYPYALVVLLMTLYTRIDMIMIGQMLEDGDQQADHYAAAYRLLDAANMFGYLFATLLLPMFARQLKLRAAVHDLVRMGIQFIWAGAIPLALLSVVFAPEIMQALYPDKAADPQILVWLMLSFLAISGSYIYGTLLTANGDLMAMNRIFLIGIGANVSLNYWLIPNLLAEGAAIATFATQSFVFLAQLWLAKKQIRLRFDPIMLGKLAVFGIICYLSTNYLSAYLFNWTWYWLLGFLLILQIVFAVLIRLLDWKVVWKMVVDR